MRGEAAPSSFRLAACAALWGHLGRLKEALDDKSLRLNRSGCVQRQLAAAWCALAFMLLWSHRNARTLRCVVVVTIARRSRRHWGHGRLHPGELDVCPSAARGGHLHVLKASTMLTSPRHKRDP